MPVLTVDRTQKHHQCWGKIKPSQLVYDAVESWALTFNFESSTRATRVFVSPRRKVEVWEVRLGNPTKGQGSSGGYRMLCFFVAEESTMYLDWMEERGAIGFKGEKPKAKAAYAAYVKGLKGYLASLYDPA